MTYLLVFFSVFLADVAWAMYFKSIADKKEYRAGFWGALVYLLGFITVTHYVENKWLILPALCGAFLGTTLTLKYFK